MGAVADLSDGRHRQRRGLHDPGCQGTGLGHEIGGADHRVDEPPATRLGRVEAPACVEDLVGHSGGEHPGQAHRRGVGHEPQRGLRQPEAGVVGSNHEIGGQDDLESAADGHAVHRGDHRLEQAGQLAETPEAALAVVGLELLAACCGVEVPPGAEESVTGAGEDRDPQTGIIAEGSEHPAQFAARGRVDGVGLGTVDGDLQHRAVGDGCHRAGGSSLSHGPGARPRASTRRPPPRSAA